MPRIVITEFMDEEALADFPTGWSIDYRPALVDDREATLASVETADALIVRNRTRVDRSLLERAPGLRAVGRLGVGLDNIDTAACTERNIAVLPATGANAASVAEYVIGAAITLVRRAFDATDRIAAGAWPRAALGRGGEIGGRTLGLFGFGMIAREVAFRARALGMSVSAHDPHLSASDPAWNGTENVAFQALLARSDVLSLHVPLTDQTRGMFDAAVLTRMKPTAVLINTARGGIVDEQALVRALRDDTIAGAALDVFEAEPPTDPALFENVPNLILTPHIAGVTDEANRRVSAMTVRNVRHALGG